MNRRHALALALMWVVAVSGLPVLAQDAPPAPFGLSWLASSDQVRSLGVNLSPIEIATFGKSFTATNLPKALSDLDEVYLSFGYDDRLFRVTAFGTENKDDGYGTRVKTRYEELATALTKTYTAGEIEQITSSDSYFGRPENFAYSIAKNEAYWFRLFTSSVADIELAVVVNGVDDTLWRMIYTHRAAETEFEKSKATQEQDAL